VYACIDLHVVTAWRVALILFIFGIQELIHPRSLPEVSEQPNLKTGASQRSRTKHGAFIEKCSNDFDLLGIYP
jgi:hypothetical protein